MVTMYTSQLWVIVCFAILVSIRNHAFAQQKKRPHIIIIMADDLGIGDVSFMGRKQFLTPNIDALAFHGRAIYRYNAPQECSPSRAAFLTGKFPISLGFQTSILNDEPWGGLPINVTTMPEVFKKAGYSTNLIGKWHLGFARKEWTPTQKGFDYHYGNWGSHIDYYNHESILRESLDDKGYDFHRNFDVECPKNNESEVYLTDLLTTEAERIITENGEKRPLFLMLSHLAPHTGNSPNMLQAPQSEIDKFSYISDYNRRVYAAMVSKLDESVGRIIQKLQQRRMLQHSIVLFLSDNAAQPFGPTANHGSNYPFKGQRGTPYQGAVRTVAAIWAKRDINNGHRFLSTVHAFDWLPTLATAAGIRLKTKADGKDWWSSLLDDKDRVSRSCPVIMNDTSNITVIYRDSLKYVDATKSSYLDSQTNTDYQNLNETDPRYDNYFNVLKNSIASRALQKHRKQGEKLDKNKVNNEISRMTSSFTSDGLKSKVCNIRTQPCLIDLSYDNERMNVENEDTRRGVVNSMKNLIRKYEQLISETPTPIVEKYEFDSDPSFHDCVWDNYLEEGAAPEPIDCDYRRRPCTKKTHHFNGTGTLKANFLLIIIFAILTFRLKSTVILDAILCRPCRSREIITI